MLDKKEVLLKTIQNREKVIIGFENEKPYKISEDKLSQLKENLLFFKNKLV